MSMTVNARAGQRLSRKSEVRREGRLERRRGRDYVCCSVVGSLVARFAHWSESKDGKRRR